MQLPKIQPKDYLKNLLYYLQSSEEAEAMNEYSFIEDFNELLKQESRLEEHAKNYKVFENGLSKILAVHPEILTSVKIKKRKINNLVPNNHKAFFRFYSLEKICKQYDIRKEQLESNINYNSVIIQQQDKKYIALISWFDILEENLQKLQKIPENTEYVVEEYLLHNNIFLSEAILKHTSEKIASTKIIQLSIITEFYDALFEDANEIFFDETGKLHSENYHKLLRSFKDENGKIILFRNPDEEEDAEIEKLLNRTESHRENIFSAYANFAKGEKLGQREEFMLFESLRKNIDHYVNKIIKSIPHFKQVLDLLMANESTRIARYTTKKRFSEETIRLIEEFKLMYQHLAEFREKDAEAETRNIVNRFFSKRKMNYQFVLDTYDTLQLLIRKEKEDLEKIVKENANKELLGESKKYAEAYSDYLKLLELKKDLTAHYENIGRILFTIVCYNIRLISKIALKYNNKRLDFEDMIQEGMLGVLKAVRMFDHKTGYKFSTYETNWIRQYISRAVDEYENYLTMSVKHSPEVRKLESYIQNYLQQHEKHPSLEEMSIHTGLSKDDIMKLLTYQYKIVSLDAKVNDEGENYLMEMISDESIDVLKYYEQIDLKENIRKALNLLTPREKTILKLRFGIDTEREYSLEEVGKLYNITRERVRQIEAKAIRKLRHKSRVAILLGKKRNK